MEHIYARVRGATDCSGSIILKVQDEEDFPDYVRDTINLEYRDSKMRDYLCSLLLTAEATGKAILMHVVDCQSGYTIISGARFVD